MGAPVLADVLGVGALGYGTPGHLNRWRLDDDGTIVEHWDVLQTVPTPSLIDNGMFWIFRRSISPIVPPPVLWSVPAIPLSWRSSRCDTRRMGVAGFMMQLFRQAPDKRQLVRSLALGGKGGNGTITSVDGTELSVRQTGEGDPLVLVHGSLDGIGAFSLVELRLAEDSSVWVYDRRGRGDSGDSEEYSLDREVDDLRAVIAATGAVPHVVAHSFGAVIALQAGLSGVPMRSLVVYEPPVNGEAIDAQQVERIHRAVEEGRIDDAIHDMAQHLAGITDDELAVAMKVPPIRKSLRDGARVVDREIEAIRTCDWSALPVTDVPTLILRGERSDAAVYPTADQTARIAVHAEITTLAGQGHLGHVFAPSAFATTVLEFTCRDPGACRP